MKENSSPGSVSQWLANPDSNRYPSGADLLWLRFGVRLVRLARRQLRQIRDPAYDADDLANSTVDAYCRAAFSNDSIRPTNRHELWRILVTISLNKSRNHRKYLSRHKRCLQGVAVELSKDDLELIPDGTANAPDLVATVADQCDFLLGLLDQQDSTGELKTIALMRLDGASKSQIAASMGYTRFTISARVNLIQAIWKHHLDQQSK